jgi:alanine racemase
MTLEAKIIGVQELEAGQEIGYGGTYTVTRKSRLAIVACGYADGYPRSAGNRAHVVLHGRRLPLVGRVSMDKLCIDVTDCAQAGFGDWVELWGPNMPVDEVAAAADTIAYELLTAVHARVVKMLSTQLK